MKRFSLTDRWRIEFAGQIYNLFNHPQYVPGFVNDIQPTTHSADASVTSFVRLTQANITRDCGTVRRTCSAARRGICSCS